MVGKWVWLDLGKKKDKKRFLRKGKVVEPFF